MRRLKIEELELDTLQNYKDVYRSPQTEFVKGQSIAYRTVLQNLGWTWKSLMSLETVNSEIKKLRERHPPYEERVKQKQISNKKEEN